MANCGWLQMLGLYLILWVTLGLGVIYAAGHFWYTAAYGVGADLRFTSINCMLLVNTGAKYRYAKMRTLDG